VTGLPWYLTALAAAVVWGLHYPLLDQALDHVSLFSVLLLTAIPILVLIPFFLPQLAADARVLAALGWRERLPILGLAFTSLLASTLLLASIDAKNATLAGLIETTYPLFIVVFAYLLFREFHLNAKVALGGALIMAGAAIVVWGSR
jgi:drug/metabolite transporter (DMT)-like permease